MNHAVIFIVGTTSISTLLIRQPAHKIMPKKKLLFNLYTRITEFILAMWKRKKGLVSHNTEQQHSWNVLEQDNGSCQCQSKCLILWPLSGRGTKAKTTSSWDQYIMITHFIMLCYNKATIQTETEKDRERRTERRDNSIRVVKVVFMPAALAPWCQLMGRVCVC